LFFYFCFTNQWTESYFFLSSLNQIFIRRFTWIGRSHPTERSHQKMYNT
jgi:hypothetical protein